MMSPFMIKVPLLTPLLMSSGYLTLDGVLAIAHEMKTGTPARPEDIPLAEESGIKKGSAAFFPMGRFAKKVMFSRIAIPDLSEVPDKTNPRRGGRYLIDQNSGEFKAATTSFLEAQADFVVWFGVGDPERVADLLRFLPGVGRKANLGYGRFDHENIMIEDAPDCSFSLFGKPARPLPVAMWQGAPSQEMLVSVKHPYWKSPRERCVVPVTRFFRRTELRNGAVTP